MAQDVSRALCLPFSCLITLWKTRDSYLGSSQLDTRLGTTSLPAVLISSPQERKSHYFFRGKLSSVPQTVKNPPAMWDTQVRYLGQEDPLEKGMATHSSILAWKMPWTEEPGGPQRIGSQRVRHDSASNTFTSRTAVGREFCSGPGGRALSLGPRVQSR